MISSGCLLPTPENSQFEGLAFALTTSRITDDIHHSILTQWTFGLRQIDQSAEPGTPRVSRTGTTLKLNRTLIIPVIGGGNVWGALQFLLPDNHNPLEATMEVLEHAGRLLAEAFQEKKVSRFIANESQLADPRQRERILLRVIQTLPDAVFQKDAAGKFVFLSDGWTNISGHQPSDSIGTSLLDYLSKQSREHGLRNMQAMMCPDSQDSDQFCAQELLLLNANGEPRWIRVMCRALRNADGRLTSIYGSISDIHEQKKAEIGLRIRDMALKSNEDAVFIADANATGYPILYVNPAFEEMTGWNSDECLGKNPQFLEGEKTDPEDLKNCIRPGTREKLRSHDQELPTQWVHFLESTADWVYQKRVRADRLFCRNECRYDGAARTPS